MDILNNTLLVPYHDSLVSGDPLKDTTIVGDIQAYTNGSAKKPAVQSNQFKVTVTSNGQKAETVLCQKIQGLSVVRDVVKQRSGGEQQYEIKLPGFVHYGEVTLYHLYTNSPVFLNWLVNGSSQGAPMLADVEIQVGDADGKMVYTLRDAFPIKWQLGDINVVSLDEIKKSSQPKSGEIPLEEVIIVYGKMDYARG